MSVIVMGGKFPTGYHDCWYLGCELWRDCAVDGKQYNCPLRPLPEKHGRLIDADELVRLLGDWGRTTSNEFVDNMPTIVEPEGD